MRSRPPEYFYFQVYCGFVGALFGLGLGILRLEWWVLAGSLLLLAAAIAFFAYLAWWRRSYDQMHPDDPSINVPFLQRTADDLSTKFVRSLTRIVGRDQT